MTYKELCANLADSERAIRKGVSGTSLAPILAGRAQQLNEMQTLYPDKYTQYVAALMLRINSPYDFDAILKSIPGR